ncbi:hypothetical protein F2Q69_00051563 [Brassica cretica]|uniref:Leucine-rich repeat-containing N-terminal plant-type domain-containing protein n=1 Tax=Brassica cretica TaxID=69181 RepID=A0A8S9PM86_BRACR|nr:hypothetical protein F2Q69_00051563 [Brassica cretica]
MLHGNIHRQLTNLTSLAVFNVSYNNLSGLIPQGRQFDTFNDMSYLSNPLLCGLPTKRSCEEAKKSTEEADNRGREDDLDMMVFYWTSASTYVTALIAQFLYFSSSKLLNPLTLLLGQIHVYKSCIEEERKALLNLKTYLASEGSRQHHHFPTFDYILHTWTNDTTSDCCKWEGVNCTLTSAQVNGLAFLEYMYLPDKALLNLSLMHPFEELRSLNLSGAEYQFGGLFDDVEGNFLAIGFCFSKAFLLDGISVSS